ncbi:uncharacterized protein CCR75_007896 [Bremia lactucae]|uniref:Uncharacterized protein n=1 Tax=Bremia lactucae TaxID=4779 RepID=A0A976FHW9_BRELC|nr:hypothetical protein CCR75_007896 [Bremia lactucae]
MTTKHSNNPFDGQDIDRESFPSFAAAMANMPSAEMAEQKGGVSTLDWSIDTLAELKPMHFSPLPHQKNATSTSRMLFGANDFFEDEKQYQILQTPLSTAQLLRGGSATIRKKMSLMMTPSPSIAVHRRCIQTTARWHYTLRERQHQLDKLQTAPPLINSKRPLRRCSEQQLVALPNRSTLLRQAKRKCLFDEWNSPDLRPPKWSPSPIATTGSSQSLCVTPSTIQYDVMTPSPLALSPSTTTYKQ